MGKAIKAAKELATKHEAAVQALRDMAGEKADELLAEAEKLAESTTMTQTKAVYAIIQKMTDEANAQLVGGMSSDEAAEALAQLGQPEDPAPSVTLEELEGMDDALWAQEETEGPRPEWRITDDGCADWACRKIAEEKAELDRIRELAEAQIQKIEEKLAAAELPGEKTAPVFSPGSSRNTSRRCRTRPQRPKRATACCLARSRGNMAAHK